MFYSIYKIKIYLNGEAIQGNGFNYTWVSLPPNPINTKHVYNIYTMLDVDFHTQERSHMHDYVSRVDLRPMFFACWFEQAWKV